MRFDTILSPEFDRIPRLPIKAWMTQLRGDFKYLSQFNGNKITWLKNLEVISNHLSLICFYSGYSELSEQICRTAQQFFSHAYFVQGHNCLDKSGFLQPGINLIRLNRFTNHMDTALNKLNKLILDKENFCFDEGCIAVSELSQSSRNLVINCYFEELIKNHLRLKNYSTVAKILADIQTLGVTAMNMMWLLEVQLITQFYLNGESTVVELLQLYDQNIPESYKSLFYLKHIHLLIAVNKVDAARGLFQIYLDKTVLPESCDLINLKYWHMMIQTYLFLNIKQDEEKLVGWLLLQFQQQCDELSILELLKLVRFHPAFQEQWQHYYGNTDYILFKRKIDPHCRANHNLVKPFANQLLNFLSER